MEIESVVFEHRIRKLKTVDVLKIIFWLIAILLLVSFFVWCFFISRNLTTNTSTSEAIPNPIVANSTVPSFTTISILTTTSQDNWNPI